MDSPRSAPEASSHVVLLPPMPSTQFMWGAEMPPPTANTIASTRIPGRNIHAFTRSMGTVSTLSSALEPIDAFAASRGVHGDENSAAGPTTRSRKRSSNQISTGEKSTKVDAAADDDVPSVASATSRKRKPSSSPSSSSKRCRATNRKKPPPGAALKKAPPPGASKKIGSDEADGKKPEAEAVNCCICMCDVEPYDLSSINGCDHRFCFGCIEKWSERENKCPLCKARFTKIDRVNKKRKKGTKNTKKVKQRDQRTDLVPGAALEGLIANLNRSSGLARIIFGGFEGFQIGGVSAVSGGIGNPSARTSFSTANRSDDDSEDDDSPMAAFMRALHGGPGATGIRMSTTVVRPMTVTARFTTTSSRSYARNVHDSTAGNGAENPLEIDDDSVDEVIEID